MSVSTGKLTGTKSMPEQPKVPHRGGSEKVLTELSSVDWSFPEADTDKRTHGIHPYPARMIPQIADHLLSYFLSKGDIEQGDLVYDSFGGSGTTAVEARRHGLNSILVDINPLACMIARLKADPPNPESISRAKRDLLGRERSSTLKQELQQVDPTEEEYSIDLDSNYEWFPEPQLSQLGYLREQIDDLAQGYHEGVVRFFRVALSETSRLVSYQRNNEFKRYRIPEEERDSFDPDTWEVFTEIVTKNQQKINEFHSETDSDLETIVYQTDARNPSEVQSEADVIITSPPYGDHKTTVAYGQFSTDPAIIANGVDPDSMRRVDKEGLGGNGGSTSNLDGLRQKSPTLDSTLDVLEEKNGRADDALQFFSDYYETIEQNDRILKAGQPIAMVVANRTMSRVNIPTHQITLELYEHLGFKTEHVLPRSIPRKTLPFENNPGGVSEENGELMAQEYILIMRSPNR